jgi:hypothetical protein
MVWRWMGDRFAMIDNSRCGLYTKVMGRNFEKTEWNSVINWYIFRDE